LGIRTHVCDCCGYIEDRDVNAAKNILKAGMRPSERNAKDCLERAPSSPLL
jgi:transposase